MTPELDALTEALFAAHPTLLQIQYDPPHAIPAEASHVMAWVTTQGDDHDDSDPSLWTSVDYLVPGRAMPDVAMCDDILAFRQRCDEEPDVTPFVRHRNPSPPPAPVIPSHDELKMRYAQDAVQHGYMSADQAIETLGIDPASQDAAMLRKVQEILDQDASMGGGGS